MVRAGPDRSRLLLLSLQVLSRLTVSGCVMGCPPGCLWCPFSSSGVKAAGEVGVHRKGPCWRRVDLGWPPNVRCSHSSVAEHASEGEPLVQPPVPLPPARMLVWRSAPGFTDQEGQGIRRCSDSSASTSRGSFVPTTNALLHAMARCAPWSSARCGSSCSAVCQNMASGSFGVGPAARASSRRSHAGSETSAPHVRRSARCSGRSGSSRRCWSRSHTAMWL